MTKPRIVRMTLAEALARGGGKSDWARVDALTDAEIAANVASDPDAYDTPPGFWDKAVLVYPPRKKVITLGLDDDVLAYFKRGGKGYQSRINAVLRTFMLGKSGMLGKTGGRGGTSAAPPRAKSSRGAGGLAEPKAPRYRAGRKARAPA
ncbi:MAG: BrnA antitoxin family protein [Rhodospirillaceae bacterium]|nr:BrnA antitoxin family protein [Rhodospirillaceae bacterium]